MEQSTYMRPPVPQVYWTIAAAKIDPRSGTIFTLHQQLTDSLREPSALTVGHRLFLVMGHLFCASIATVPVARKNVPQLKRRRTVQGTAYPSTSSSAMQHLSSIELSYLYDYYFISTMASDPVQLRITVVVNF
jgi:hypothetical protein